MGTRWIHLFSKMGRRLGFELVRPWRRRELVHLSVDDLPSSSGYRHYDEPLNYRGADDVVPLLGGGYRTIRRNRTPDRSGPEPSQSVGPRSESRSVAGNRPASIVLDPFQQEPAPGHVNQTLGGWTMSTSLDCE